MKPQNTVRRKGRNGGVGEEVKKQEHLNAQKDRLWSHISVSDEMASQ